MRNGVSIVTVYLDESMTTNYTYSDKDRKYSIGYLKGVVLHVIIISKSLDKYTRFAACGAQSTPLMIAMKALHADVTPRDLFPRNNLDYLLIRWRISVLSNLYTSVAIWDNSKTMCRFVMIYWEHNWPLFWVHIKKLLN